jgi:hypothetical protein
MDSEKDWSIEDLAGQLEPKKVEFWRKNPKNAGLSAGR